MSATLNLPVDLTSPDQLSATSMELTDYLSRLRDARVRAKTSGSDQQLPDMSHLLTDLLQISNVDPEDSAALEDLRSQLDTLLTKAPVVHLTLAGLPGRTVKRQITLWFRTEINPLTLLTFAARADLGGGVVVYAGSHVYDYSFRRHILDNKKRISELAFSV